MKNVIVAPPLSVPPRSHMPRGLLTIALVIACLSAASTEARATELELVLHGGPFVPSEGEDGIATVGIVGGATALLRFNAHLALGAKYDTANISWSQARSGDSVNAPASFEGSIQSTLQAFSFRWYVLDNPTWVPFLELDVGYLSVIDTPEHSDCGDGSLWSGGLALGLDWSWSSWLRVGALAGARPLRMGRGCFELGHASPSPPPPPAGDFALSGQLTLTTVWTSE